MRRFVVLALCLLPLAFAGCGGGDDSDTTTEAAATTTEASTTTTGGSSAPECKDVKAPKASDRTADQPSGDFDTSKTYKVTMDTSCGSFTITLDPEQSPNAVQSIVSLVQDGFYDDTVFHRILPGFVIQGGDPTATGGGGPGYSTVDTPPTDAAYPHGVVAMAKSGAEPAGTAGSQFFVVTSDAPAPLTPDYAIVGTVTEGLDVVDKIGEYGPANDPTGAGAPTKVIVLEKATDTES
jgi:peptidyl-prolyl cis-trans isomerase B (cyclophilin B)